MEQAEYEAEAIDWTTIEFVDNQVRVFVVVFPCPQQRLNACLTVEHAEYKAEAIDWMTIEFVDNQV